MTAMKKSRFPGLVPTALAGLCLSAVTGAELANNGFEADAPAEVGYSALVLRHRGQVRESARNTSQKTPC